MLQSNGKERERGVRPYAVFLKDLHEELQQAVADLENLGFHHSRPETSEFQHYLRVCTWADEVALRRYRFGTAKAKKQQFRALPFGPTPPEALAGQADQRHLDAGDGSRHRPGQLNAGSEKGPDTDQDDTQL